MLKVSLIIVNGRGVSTLINTLENSQNLHFFHEIVVVDITGSVTDKSLENFHRNMKKINATNTPFVNRNRLLGCKASMGDLCLFLDDDDYVDGAFVPRVSLTDDVLVLGGTTCKNSNAKQLHDLSSLNEWAVKQCVWGGFSRVVMRKSAFMENADQVVEFPAFQDQALWILLSRFYKPGYLPSKYITYNVDSSRTQKSISQSISKTIPASIKLLSFTHHNRRFFSFKSLIYIYIGILRAVIKRTFRILF